MVQAATSTSTTTTTPKEQETMADPNADEDIFAKFEDSPSPAASQVHTHAYMAHTNISSNRMPSMPSMPGQSIDPIFIYYTYSTNF